jgi:hypothetical protein
MTSSKFLRLWPLHLNNRNSSLKAASIVHVPAITESDFHHINQ